MKRFRVPTLTIAGSDSSGGAGIQADLKTFAATGTYGMSVITAITAQNTLGVTAVEEISKGVVEAQIRAVFDDIPPAFTKIGMVSNEDIIVTIAKTLREYKYNNLVMDPVMISKSGYDLLQPQAKRALIEELMPLAYILTPNLPEAEEITGMKIETIEEMKVAGEMILSMGPRYVLMKGGHLKDSATDLFMSKEACHVFEEKRVERKNTHGTGCTLSAAITAHLALGYSPIEAVKASKHYITKAIEHSFDIGKGIGPVHHFYKQEGEKEHA